MRIAFATMVAVCLLLSSSGWAQQPSVPKSYVAALEAHIPGLDQPLSFTLYRDGSRERIEMGEGALLFDFDAHKYYDIGMLAGKQRCSIGRYPSARAPIGQDLITGSADALKQLPAGAQRKFIRREVVNGIPARLEEISGGAKPADPDQAAPSRIWLAEQGGFIVKTEAAGKDGRPYTAVEMKRFSAEKPAAALLAVPPNCTVTDSEMDDTGTMRAHAEATINAGASFGTNLGDGTSHASGSASMTTNAAPAPVSNGKLTAVALKMVEKPSPGPCGRKLEVTGEVTTDGPATVWYRVYSNVGGVEFSGGQNGAIELKGAGSALVVKDATFPTAKQGEMRIQAAVQGPDGRHGAVTISNVVPFQTVCTGK
jgi:hypothetical protein